jgi:hypothetical protein
MMGNTSIGREPSYESSYSPLTRQELGKGNPLAATPFALIRR